MLRRKGSAVVDHLSYRDLGRRGGTHPVKRFRRAFSLLEVTAGIAVCGVIAGVVTLAVAQAQVTASKARLDRQVQGVVSSMVDQVVTAPYSQLTQNSFTRPQACPDDATRSCVAVWGRDVEVSWASVATTDLSTVTITATGLYATDRSVVVPRTVAAPGPDWSEGAATVRVALTGDVYTGKLYVVNTAGTVIGDGSVSSQRSSIVVTDGSCTSSSPCRLALTPSGGALNGDWSLDAVNTFGTAGRIVTNGGVSDITAVVTSGARFTVSLSALNPDGRTTSPSVRGSVCLWANFDDGVAARSIPGCNTAQADRIVFRSYAPDPSRPQLLVGVPRGAVVTITADRADGDCPAVTGHLVRVGSEWVSGRRECTSWTWGSPSSFVTGSVSTPASSSSWVIGDVTSTTARWTTSNGSPASGYLGEQPWVKPRDARACSTGTSCAPVNNPEASQCPDAHCLSSAIAPPHIALPVRGDALVYAVRGTSSSNTSFSVVAMNPDGSDSDTTIVSLLESPSAGSVKHGGSTVSAGSAIESFTGSTSIIELVWAAPSGSSVSSFTLRLSSPQGVTDVPVSLSTVTAPWSVQADPVVVRQGSSASVRVLVTGNDGQPFAGASVTATGINGAVISSATTNTAGIANLNVAVNAVAAGSRTLTYTATASVAGSSRAAVGTGSVSITASSTTITVTAANVGQSGSGSALVEVTDATGVSVPGAVVEFTVTNAAGEPTRSVHARPTGCVTADSGSCSVLVTADPAATSGLYRLNAVAGSASGVGNFQVAAQAYSISMTRTTLTQESSVDATITVTDASGTPMSRQTVVVTSRPGITASVQGTTNSLGRTVLRLTATSSATPGSNALSLAVGAASQTVNVQVAAKIERVTASPISVVLGGSTSATFTAFDTANDPAASASLSMAVDGLIVPTVVTTNASGVGTFSITASSNTRPGPHLLTISTGGVSLIEVPVTVVRGVENVTSATVLRPTGATQNLVVRFFDANGVAMPGRTANLTPRVTSISQVVATGVSDASGTITFSVSVRADAIAGPTRFDVTVDGRTYPLIVSVKK